MIHFRRAFLTLDVITGLLLLGIFATVLSVSAHSQARGSAYFSDLRSASRAAEAALSDLQFGRDRGVPTTMPATIPGAEVHVRIEFDRTTASPAGMHWVRAIATCRGQTAVLDGLVPETSAGDEK